MSCVHVLGTNQHTYIHYTYINKVITYEQEMLAKVKFAVRGGLISYRMLYYLGLISKNKSNRSNSLLLRIS